MSRPLIIFPHQLFKSVLHIPKDTVVYMVESRLFFKTGNYPKKLLALHRASMQALRERLLIRGHTVHYLDILTFPSLEVAFARLEKDGCKQVEWFQLLNPTLEKEVAKAAHTHNIQSVVLSSPGTPLHLVASAVKMPPLPELWQPEKNRYVEEALEYVGENFPTNPGSLRTFPYPTTYADAEDWLEDFLIQRFPHFSTYKEALLHQSLLPILLGIGLLTLEQIQEHLAVYSKARGVSKKAQKDFLAVLTA